MDQPAAVDPYRAIRVDLRVRGDRANGEIGSRQVALARQAVGDAGGDLLCGGG